MLVVLGNISYSLYLTHSIVTVIVRSIPTVKGIISVIVSLFAAIIIAYVSWYLIEQKFTNWIKMKLDKK
jgi:peptidoglycan/LPS O-acetylase OafA/YrhL